MGLGHHFSTVGLRHLGSLGDLAAGGEITEVVMVRKPGFCKTPLVPDVEMCYGSRTVRRVERRSHYALSCMAVQYLRSR